MVPGEIEDNAAFLGGVGGGGGGGGGRLKKGSLWEICKW